jgi:hypothetical protein
MLPIVQGTPTSTHEFAESVHFFFTTRTRSSYLGEEAHKPLGTIFIHMPIENTE